MSQNRPNKYPAILIYFSCSVCILKHMYSSERVTTDGDVFNDRGHLGSWVWHDYFVYINIWHTSILYNFYIIFIHQWGDVRPLHLHLLFSNFDVSAKTQTCTYTHLSIIYYMVKSVRKTLVVGSHTHLCDLICSIKWVSKYNCTHLYTVRNFDYCNIITQQIYRWQPTSQVLRLIPDVGCLHSIKIIYDRWIDKVRSIYIK